MRELLNQLLTGYLFLRVDLDAKLTNETLELFLCFPFHLEIALLELFGAGLFKPFLSQFGLFVFELLLGQQRKEGRRNLPSLNALQDSWLCIRQFTFGLPVHLVPNAVHNCVGAAFLLLDQGFLDIFDHFY